MFFLTLVYLKKDFAFYSVCRLYQTSTLRSYNLTITYVNGAYWISSNSLFIQYCDSNIGLFSTASHIVVALPTIATAIVVALTRS